MKIQVLAVLSVFIILIGSAPDGACGEVKTGTVRTPLDSIGYATSPEELEWIVRLAGESEKPTSTEAETPDGSMIGAVCPHDDYLYAGPVYVEVMKRVKAPVVIIFGVCHAARRRGIQGRLIFDSYDAWRGPYGDCPVSDLREDLMESLPGEYLMVSNEIHDKEHSIESLIPFLQYPGFGGEERVNDLSIIPVLVTGFPGKLQRKVAGRFASALNEEMDKRGWTQGEDLMILISADCVHYGDRKWGGRGYAPFGTDRDGFREAIGQEMDIIDLSLVGRLDLAKVKRFRDMVERDDPEWPYRVTWCGVHSIPFGLHTLIEICQLRGRKYPEGVFLEYGTSLDAPDRKRTVGNLGVTNISTFHHWVGYAAIGFW